MNSLYHDVKFEYLCKNLFINDQLASEIAANLFIIEGVENLLMEASSSGFETKGLDEVSIQKMMLDKMNDL